MPKRLWIVLLLVSLTVYAQNPKPWAVEDQIAVERLPSYLEDDLSPPFHYVTSGDLVAFITLKADVRTDETEARLRVFDTNDLRSFAANASSRFPRPVFEHSVRSRANRPGIGDLKWSGDGATLLFLVQKDSGRNALYRWDRGTTAPSKLLGLETAISTYDVLGTSSKVAVYSVSPPTRDPRTYAPELVNGRSLYSAMSKDWTFPYQLRPQRVHVANLKDGTVRSLQGTVSIQMGTFPSPDGRFIGLTAPMNVRWLGDCWRHVYSPVAFDQLDAIGQHELQYAIVDVEKGYVALPMNGPAGFVAGGYSYSHVVWSSDSTRAIIPFTFSGADSCGSTAKESTPGVFETTADGARILPIYRFDGLPTRDNRTGAVQEITWDRAGSNITLVFAGPPGAENRAIRRTWTRTDTGWKPAQLPATQSPKLQREDPLVLEVRQSLNVPPAIYALGDGGAARMLHDLAPHARGRTFGRTEMFSWNDSKGRKWEGILAWPTEYRPDRRYPLIIQTHGFTRGAFFAEGPTTTAFPGRAATERGFLVLTIAENREAMFVAPEKEADNILDGYKSAIAELDRRGLADVTRVGIIGWSRTSFHVKYALTAAPDLFAAAVAADGNDYGYAHYLHTVDLFGGEEDNSWKHFYGGAPYSNWERWIAKSPTFNVDKVKAPFRGEANSRRVALISEWEFYAGLRKLRKPAELWVYPDGEHFLLRPLERRISQEGSLDWIDYWLNNRRDTSSARREQYERWDAMRVEREAAGTRTPR